MSIVTLHAYRFEGFPIAITYLSYCVKAKNINARLASARLTIPVEIPMIKAVGRQVRQVWAS